MSDVRAYPKEIVRAGLARHQGDAAASNVPWLSEVIAILSASLEAIPEPVEQVDTVPRYVYPH